MFSRAFCIAVLLIYTLYSSGCGRYQETDSIAFVLAMGIDKAEKGITVTYQIAIPRTATGASEGGRGGESYILNSNTSVNLAESRNLLGSTMSRVPNATHIKAIIIGEDIAREGLGPVIAPLMRFREYRGSIYVIVTKGTAREFMESNRPKIETIPSKFYDGMAFQAKDKGSYYLMTDLHDFYLRMKNEIGSPYAVYAGVNPMNQKGAPINSKAEIEKVEEYDPGNIPRSGTEDPVELIGTALFRGEKMVGSLTSEETRMLAILQGEFRTGFIPVTDPLIPKETVNVLARMGEQPQISLRIDQGKATIDIKIRLEADISSIPSGINYEQTEYKELLESQISQVVAFNIRHLLKYTQELRTDPVGFTAYMRPHFKTHAELSGANLAELYSQADINLDIKTAVRRSGLMWRTSPLKKE